MEGCWPGLTKLSFCIPGASGDIREHIGNGLDTRYRAKEHTQCEELGWAPTSHVKIQHLLTTDTEKNQLRVSAP